MLKDNIQKQITGNDSVNIQAKKITINGGLNYSDVKEIVLETFNSNFPNLKQEALELTTKRAKEFLEEYLSKIDDKEIFFLNRFNDPDFLINFIEAQKSYATKGYKFQMNLLIQMLREKSSLNSLSTYEITLDESLHIVPRLTQNQIDFLTLVLVLKNIKIENPANEDTLITFLKKNINPFIQDSLTITDFVHLESIGCINKRNLGGYIGLFSLTYKFESLFMKGFTKDFFESKVGNIAVYNDFLVPHTHDYSLYQLFSMHQSTIQELCKKKNLDKSITQNIDRVFHDTKMSQAEIDEYFVNLEPLLKNMIQTFKVNYRSYELSTIGVLISIINLKTKTDQNLNFEDCFQNRRDSI